VYDSAQIGSVYGSAKIGSVYGSAKIGSVYDSAQIDYVSGSAQIGIITGLAIIGLAFGKCDITAKGNSIIRVKNGEANITASKTVTVVNYKETKNKNWKWYESEYPVITEKNKAILYKAVHKKENGYFSDYDKNFEYKIGESMKHDNAPASKGCCSVGLHVSHKYWAINFGRQWGDVALLECEVPVSKIVVASDCDGKVRTSELKVLREIPKEEWHD